MAHGDLHPRNILVTISPRLSNRDAGESQGEVSAQEQLDTVTGTSQVTVTGILDWEMRGWYPEYWEDLKARNTITIGRDSGFSDWWKYLPDNINAWPKEHAVDVMLSRWHG